MDALLGSAERIGRDAHAAAVVMMEPHGQRALAMLLEQKGPHLVPMLTSIASELAQRRKPTADAMLAVLTHLGREQGRHEFDDAWARRSAEADVTPAALHHGVDSVARAIEVDHACGDGVNVMLAIDNPAGSYTAAVYIDHNLGGMAKDLLIGPPVEDTIAQFADSDDGFVIRELPLSEAFWRFTDAIAVTDRTYDAPVSDDFHDLLDLVARRFQLLATSAGPEPTDAPWRPTEMTNAERVAHVAAFMASPEFSTLAPDDRDEAIGIVRLWIDHAVGYTVGPARRVSPVLVELFCCDWFPRKVAADEAMVEVAPAAIAAWLRFAARTTGLDDRWLRDALHTLDEVAPDLRRALDDPAAWGLAKSLLGGRASGALGGNVVFDDDHDDVTATTTTSMHLALTSAWKPLEVQAEGANVHVEADPSRVIPSQYAKTKLIASQATSHAAALLGPSFAQPAMDLAVELGSIDPSPYTNTQTRSWAGAIVWLLAEDNDAFEPRTPGRRRDDLAAELPLTAATYQTKAKKIREALGLTKGEFQVPHNRLPG